MPSDVTTMRCKCKHQIFLQPPAKKFVRCDKCGAINCTSCLAVHMNMNCKTYQEGLQSTRRTSKLPKLPEPQCGRHQESDPTPSKYGEDSDEDSGEEYVCGNEGVGEGVCTFTFTLPRGATQFRCPFCLVLCTFDGPERKYKSLTRYAEHPRERTEENAALSKQMDSSENYKPTLESSVVPSRNNVVQSTKYAQSPKSHAETSKRDLEQPRNNCEPTESCMEHTRNALVVRDTSSDVREEASSQKRSTDLDHDACPSADSDVEMMSVEEHTEDVNKKGLENSFETLHVQENYYQKPVTDYQKQNVQTSHRNPAMHRQTEYTQSWKPTETVECAELELNNGVTRQTSPPQISIITDGQQEVLVKCNSPHCDWRGFVHINQEGFTCPMCKEASTLKGSGPPLATAEYDSDISQKASTTSLSDASQNSKRKGRGQQDSSKPQMSTTHKVRADEVMVYCKTARCNGYGITSVNQKTFECPRCHKNQKVKECVQSPAPTGSESHVSKQVTARPKSSEEQRSQPRQNKPQGQEEGDSGISVYCMMPDCTGQRKISSVDRDFYCPKCKTRQCRKCYVVHGGQTCRQYEMSLKDSGQRFENLTYADVANIGSGRSRRSKKEGDW